MSTQTSRRFVFHTAPRTASRRWVPEPPTDWEGFVAWLDLDNPAAERDCGGYFLGTLRGTRKRAEDVVSRAALTLDADRAETTALPADVSATLDGVAMVIHTTYRHTPAAPRYRIIIPLSRDVTSDEYGRVAKRVMDRLGAEAYDPTAAQPERMMLRPSTQDRAHYYYAVVAGAPLDVDAVLADAPAPDEPPDYDPASVVNDYDPSRPPTEQERAKAHTLLEKAVREVRTQFNETTGEPFAGRNDATIRRLPLLLRFADGGVLDEHEVIEAIWAATLLVPGDADWDRDEYNGVVANARRMADRDGPARPVVTTPEDDFDPLEVPADERDFPPYRPDLYLAGRGALQVETVADALLAKRPLAIDLADKTLMTYTGGVWRDDGEDWVRKALTVMFRNEWTTSIQNTVLEYLRSSTKLASFSREPSTDLLNVRNGMLDWRTGELLPHDPAYHSTYQLPTEWNPEAGAPAFQRFLDTVADPAIHAFLLELLGYLIYPGNPYQVVPILYGPGSNGKSTFLAIAEQLVGPENTASVTLHDLTEDTFASADLYGKALNISDDLDDRRLESTGAFKRLAGGESLRAQRKYRDPFRFRPWAVNLFATNLPLSVSDSSSGYARRMLVVPFERRYVGEDWATLHTGVENPGILRLAVAGLRALMERGRFEPPSAVADQTETFLSEGDPVREWLANRAELDPDYWTPRFDLYRDFETWETMENGARAVMSARTFYSRLRQTGTVEEVGRKGVKGFKGVRLRGSRRVGGSA